MQLDDRMKSYEQVYTSAKLIPRCPAIIRIDGRAFHTYTRDMDKPFDEQMVLAMDTAMRAVLCDASTAKIGYTQSDEISILLTDFDNFETQQWFGGKIFKICSVAASIATVTFNNVIHKSRYAHFDARVFSIPKEDVANYLFGDNAMLLETLY